MAVQSFVQLPFPPALHEQAAARFAFWTHFIGAGACVLSVYTQQVWACTSPALANIRANDQNSRRKKGEATDITPAQVRALGIDHLAEENGAGLLGSQFPGITDM